MSFAIGVALLVVGLVVIAILQLFRRRPVVVEPPEPPEAVEGVGTVELVEPVAPVEVVEVEEVEEIEEVAQVEEIEEIEALPEVVEVYEEPEPAITWTAQLTAAPLDEAARLRLIDDLVLLRSGWAVALLRRAHEEERAPQVRARIAEALAAYGDPIETTA
jgi:hypothetical protein